MGFSPAAAGALRLDLGRSGAVDDVAEAEFFGSVTVATGAVGVSAVAPGAVGAG
ncbi:hypothetical protein [Arthrobacter sp. ISL-30]|uniref:hypothetical protein n=1 Tax=Arthrobacter sp. ISL-30 TaxID=2819109 RepID=UPI001BEC79C1|nr:hypothetical protein [Arthrobacter sp. ISL-30]MBT2513300.1 hypothetical protein [Arthrobacter sp. ISL-30]